MTSGRTIFAAVLCHVFLSSAEHEPLRISILRPRNDSFIFANENMRIEWASSPLPQGWQSQLQINGKVALQNENSHQAVDVPGLMVGHHKTQVILIDENGNPTEHQTHSRFRVINGHRWIHDNIHVDGDATHSCQASKSCRFTIYSADPEHQLGNFFRVRLVGPAIVMAKVEELGEGIYVAEYFAPDPGIYQMTILLQHVDGTGVADPGTGTPRFFVNQEIRGSPFQVEVWADEDLAKRSKSVLCKGRDQLSQYGSGRWVHRHNCLWHGDFCQGVDSQRFDLQDFENAHNDPWIWVPYNCVLRPYTAEDYKKCTDDGKVLFISGTSLFRTMYYDIICMLDNNCTANKEHEDLGFPGPPRLFFHWIARFADHELFENPPLGVIDGRTGRLRFNDTITHLIEAIAAEAPTENDIIVLGSQIFDILKAPMEDYESNLLLLIDALAGVNGSVVWRTGEALHDQTLAANWDFNARPGRYMNDPRMQRANEIAERLFRAAGYDVLDAFSVTHGREDRSHDGTHYWNMRHFHESGGDVRLGNGVSNTNAQILLNWICNSR